MRDIKCEVSEDLKNEITKIHNESKQILDETLYPLAFLDSDGLVTVSHRRIVVIPKSMLKQT